MMLRSAEMVFLLVPVGSGVAPKDFCDPAFGYRASEIKQEDFQSVPRLAAAQIDCSLQDPVAPDSEYSEKADRPWL
jgi:hypothetical protein